MNRSSFQFILSLACEYCFGCQTIEVLIKLHQIFVEPKNFLYNICDLFSILTESAMANLSPVKSAFSNVFDQLHHLFKSVPYTTKNSGLHISKSEEIGKKGHCQTIERKQSVMPHTTGQKNAGFPILKLCNFKSWTFNYSWLNEIKSTSNFFNNCLIKFISVLSIPERTLLDWYCHRFYTRRLILHIQTLLINRWAISTKTSWFQNNFNFL